MDQLDILDSLKLEINLTEDEKQAWLEEHKNSKKRNTCAELFTGELFPDTNENVCLLSTQVIDVDESREEIEVFSDGDDNEGEKNDWARFSPNSEFWTNDDPLPPRISINENSTKPVCNVLNFRLLYTHLYHLIRLPDTSKFVYAKLNINSKGLIDISVLEMFKYLMYIDLSDNNIENTEPLYKMSYLLYLNLNHNNISDIDASSFSTNFLTYLDLSHNNLEKIPDMTNFWSLKQLYLSNNKIDKISGIYHLRYLERLNLSYNRIEIIKVKVFATNLEFLDVSYNRISEMIGDIENLRISQTLSRLNLSHNSISHLKKLKFLHWLKRLDLSHNNIFDARELNYLINLKKLESISLVNNPISHMKENRLFLIYLLPSLFLINSMVVTDIEKLNAHNLFSNSLTQKAFQIYSNLTLKRYSPKITSTYSLERTMEVTDVNLVILVGPPGSGKWETINNICAKLPQYVRMGRLVTSRDVHEHMTVVSLKEFNELFDTGRVVTYEFRLGAGFALCWDELKGNDKIILVGLELSAALCLVWQGLNPYMILTMPENKQLHLERLKKLSHDNNSIIPRILSDHIPTTSTLTLNTGVHSHDDGDSSFQELFPSCYKRLHSSLSSITKICDDEKTNTEHEIINSITKYISQKNLAQHSEKDNNLSDCNSDKLLQEEIDVEYVKNKDFIDSVLESRDEYINIHHDNPGLFISSVKSDDMGHLETRIMQMILDLFKKSKRKVNSFYNPKEDSLYDYVIQKNVNKLLPLTDLQFTPDLGKSERYEDNSPNQASFFFNR